jgi:hypothetical protein
VHTSIVGSNGTFLLDPAPPTTGSITINHVSQSAPTVVSGQHYTTEANTTLNAGNPGTPAPLMAPPLLGSGGNLTTGMTYYYVVTAVGPAGESVPSAQVLVTPVVGSKSVALYWSPVSMATAYNVYRTTTRNVYGPTSLLGVVTTTSFGDSGSATVAGTPPAGLLTGANSPQEIGSDPYQALTVNAVNGTAYTLGTPTPTVEGGSVSIYPGGAFAYTPAPNYVGSDSFAFTAVDGSGNVSSAATVSVLVTPTLSVVINTIISGTGPYGAGAMVEADIFLDNPNPSGGVGPLSGFNIALTYDPQQLSTDPGGADVFLGDGQINPGNGYAPDNLPTDWQTGFTTNALTAGVVGISAYGSGSGTDLVTGPVPLELASVDFTVIGTVAGSTPVELVTTTTASATTAINGIRGTFALNPAIYAQGSAFVTGVDTMVSIQGAPGVVVNPDTLPNGDVNSAYIQTITASGGSSPYSYAVTSGALPTGLTLSSSGVLSGTPMIHSAYTFTVTAADAQGTSASQDYTITINPAVAINTASLANGDVGAGYSEPIIANGGNGSYTFAKASGTLPSGLTLSSAGILSGTVTTQGSYSFTVSATDSLGSTASHNYTITINPTLAFTTTALPDGDVSSTYAQTIAVAGGSGTYAYTVISGTLPTGLSLSTAGVLSGTPTTPGTFTFTVNASDTLRGTASESYTVSSNLAIAILTTTLPDGDLNGAYNQTLSTNGGSGSYTYAVTAGSLPTGLALSATGVLGGSPTWRDLPPLPLPRRIQSAEARVRFMGSRLILPC